MIELEIVAFIASTIGVGGALPQIIKIIKTKETRALSYGQYFMSFIAGILWVSYGFLAPLYSIVFWNSISTIMALTVLILKFKNEHSEIFSQNTLILTLENSLKKFPAYTGITSILSALLTAIGK
jgi:MtN3 and saliva related transmembrane protein